MLHYFSLILGTRSICIIRATRDKDELFRFYTYFENGNLKTDDRYSTNLGDLILSTSYQYHNEKVITTRLFNESITKFECYDISDKTVRRDENDQDCNLLGYALDHFEYDSCPADFIEIFEDEQLD